MKKLFIYIIILYTISGFSQKKYNVDIIEEKHKYYKDESLGSRKKNGEKS